MSAIWLKYEIVAEMEDAIIKNEVQVFLKNHNKISLATLIKIGLLVRVQPISRTLWLKINKSKIKWKINESNSNN